MNFAYYLHDEKSQADFEKKLLWFKSRYNLVSINDLREHIYTGKPLKNACMLSVDDGWRSTYEVIYPVMKKHNVTFTIFVSPHVLETGMNFWYYTMRFCDEAVLKQMLVDKGYYSEEAQKYSFEMLAKEIPIDDLYSILDEYKAKYNIVEPRGFCNLTELIEMHKSGLVEVGAHTMIHPILSREIAPRSEKEIKDSIDKLSDLLQKRVHSFAYPNGLEYIDFGEREMSFAKDAGIDMAFSVNPGVITNKTNPLAIPRWGSEARLKFGRLGMYLPSRMNQTGIRKELLKYRLK